MDLLARGCKTALQRWKAIPVGEDVYWLADVDNPI